MQFEIYVNCFYANSFKRMWRGGDDISTPSAGTAEGFWSGLASNGSNLALVVLENGETWGLYGGINILGPSMVNQLEREIHSQQVAQISISTIGPSQVERSKGQLFKSQRSMQHPVKMFLLI